MSRLGLISKMLLLFWLAAVTTAQAADDEYLLTEATYKALEAAQEDMDEKNFSRAETALRDLLEDTDNDSYDEAMVLQTLGYLYSETEDYPQAVETFREALATDALPEDMTHNLRYNLAQLLISDEKFNEGIEVLQRWLERDDSPPDNAYLLLATAQYQVKQYTNTVRTLRTLISRASTPKESWYRLMLSAHLEMNQSQQAIEVLQTLIVMNPREKSYWQQISALYQQQEEIFYSLSVQMLAKRLDLGDGQTVIRLADTYRYLSIPYKSARLLTQALEDGRIEASFKNLDKLANSWLAAREYTEAAEVLQRMARIDDSGETDLQLAQVHVSKEDWQPALDALMPAIDKLSGAEQGRAYLLAGMAYANLEVYDESRTMLEQATEFEEERQRATQWLNYIASLTEENGDDDDTDTANTENGSG